VLDFVCAQSVIGLGLLSVLRVNSIVLLSKSADGLVMTRISSDSGGGRQ